MGKGYLDEWDDFEKWQKTGHTGSASSTSMLGGSAKWGGSSGHKTHASCHTTHPPLAIPGTDKVIYGGSCGSPSVTDADVYIGFDYGMRFTQRSFPWKKGVEFLFEIPDMGVPGDAVEFEKMVKWTLDQLKLGKKVHCGCIGGHGRTGTFLAALCSAAGEPDAIRYVREHYCKKAVESARQTAFLVKHFGVTAADGYKETAEYKAKHTVAKVAKVGKGGKKGGAGVEVVQGAIETFTPMAQPFSIVSRN
jgi:hypothetical protein